MTTEADKITAELMALARAHDWESLEQAIRRAVDWEQVGSIQLEKRIEYVSNHEAQRDGMGVSGGVLVHEYKQALLTHDLLAGTPLYTRSPKP